jgi:formate-dependent nitrite reductase cytochrome c552 subunit
MSHTLRVLGCLAGMGVVWAIFAGESAQAGRTDSELEKVLADWQKRQHRMDTVEYRVRGVHKVHRGAYNALAEALSSGRMNRDVPSDNVTKPISFTILLDFVKGRHREKSEMASLALDKGKINSNLDIVTFNGSVEKQYVPKEQNPGRDPLQPELSIVIVHKSS